MNEKQTTFGEKFGLDNLVDTSKLPDDIIACSDGTTIRRGDAFFDSEGFAHRDAADRDAADVMIVTKILEQADAWVADYTTGNTDFADCYAHVVNEIRHEWADRIKEWLKDNYGTGLGDILLTHFIDELVHGIIADLDGNDCEAKYNSSDYHKYSGSGCCLWGFKIDEYENQIDVNQDSRLRRLHMEGRLDDILDDINCDVYVSRRQRCELNDATGKFENVGRETYDPYKSNYPQLTTYHMPGGGWDFIIPADRMKLAVANAVVMMARKNSK